MDRIEYVKFFEENPDILGLPIRELPEINTQNRKRQAKNSLHPSKICGADTETINGRVWLFSTEFGVWEIDTFGDLIEVLYSKEHTTRWKSGRGNRKDGTPRKATRGISPKEFFFYNLKFDSQAIFHLFEDETISNLLDGLECEITAKTKAFGDILFKVRYLEGKSLRFKPVNWKIGQFKCGSCEWWDISQYYYKQRLNDAAKENLGMEKLEKCFDGSILDVTRLNEPEYRDMYREDIEKYALLDAILAGELTRKKRSDFVKNGVRFIKPYSLANTAQRNLFDTCQIPTINAYLNDETLMGFLEKAYASYQGGLFETQGSGFMANCVAVDEVSAYPFVMRNLPDISKGNWVQGDEDLLWWNWCERREPFQIGFAEATILFDADLPWYPLTKTSSRGTLVAPRFIRGWFTAEELIEAKKWPHSQFIIGEWFYFKEDNSQNRPFRPYIDRVYQMKMDATNDPIKYNVAKILLNSIYGKTIQAIDGKAGTMFNPFYASTICGATRARMAELNRVNNFTALSMATDGMIFRKEDLQVIPNRPISAPHNLGQWEADGEGDLLVIMSGVYSMDLGHKVKTTFRGSASYFLRNYRERGLFGFCEDHSSEIGVDTRIEKPISARQARQKSDYTKMNVFVPQEFTLRAQGDSNKRVWGGVTPTTFGDLLDGWWESHPHQQLH